MEDHPIKRPEKTPLTEINSYLTCYLCKGYLIDATTISECLHSFCRSCIIKFLQDNSYCPVCEVIINKAKPNLKLDKTLQDIVYKLVPELFLHEMTRRKQFYRQYPQIAVRMSPEERGEDTERTIFNPQDCISLSIEYVSSDSSPGAIQFPGCKVNDKVIQLTSEENQKLMKRYLQCPGMCRVEVLKKFVRNKYNVDTNEFHIDILYKRVPLPDHYTLIDIAYIYSWKRNEPMKFFFRITDINKLTERFDYFDSRSTEDIIVKTPAKTPRNIVDRGSSRKRESLKKRSKSNKLTSPKCSDICDKNIRSDGNKVENDGENARVENNTDSGCDNKKEDTTKSRVNKFTNDSSDENKRTVKDAEGDDQNAEKSASELRLTTDSNGVEEMPEKEENVLETEGDAVKNIIKGPDKIDKTRSAMTQCDENKSVVRKDPEKDTREQKENVDEQTFIAFNPDVSKLSDVQPQNQKSDNKNPVYTNITLNRTNNVEIITKIQKVSNKDGQPIGLNIIKQTVKSNNKNVCVKPDNGVSNKVKPDLSRPSTSSSEVMINNGSIKGIPQPKTSSINIVNKQKSNKKLDNSPRIVEDVEKIKFLETFQLTPSSSVDNSSPGCSFNKSEKKTVIQVVNGQKRKNSSPLKNDQSKKAKMDKKPVKKIILHPKPKSIRPPTSSNCLENNGLKSLIENCKIPSSLSITIKDGSENTRTPSLIPPVKNFIEILKLPDENGKNPDNSGANVKVPFGLGISDADSEEQVDEDLAEIAKSLTEKIPISTTVSQIVGPKPQFPIPMQTNVPPKSIQPSPVPELPTKILSMPKENKLTPRSPQTFQRIFEESIKKPDESSLPSEKDEQKSALDLSNDAPSTSAKAGSEISPPAKKPKLDKDKNVSGGTTKLIPKVPIPRLPNRTSNQRTPKQPQKNLKFEIADSMKYHQTLANLHSNTLGMNYTISVGPNVPSKPNGILASPKKEPDVPPQKPSPIPRNMSPGLGYNSPRDSPKHSPKSSPVIKHMYAPVPNQLLNQLQVNTYSQRIPSPNLNNLNRSSPKVPTLQLPSPSSSKHPRASPKSSPRLQSPAAAPPNHSPGSSSNQNSPLSPNQILEKYNIQNLAQLSANLNFNAAALGMSPNNQLAAIQHAMLLKHFEMQNRQNWLGMNQGPLLQYEKYLQSLKSGQNHLMGNIKEN